MKNTFCKIIELPEHQVLVFKDEGRSDSFPYDTTYEVKVSTDLGGVRPTISLGFDTEEKMNECFVDYSQEMAEKFVNEMINLTA